MTDEQKTLLMLRGLISQATPDEKEKFEAAEKDAREILVKHPDFGPLAIALIGAEFAAK